MPKGFTSMFYHWIAEVTSYCVKDHFTILCRESITYPISRSVWLQEKSFSKPKCSKLYILLLRSTPTSMKHICNSPWCNLVWFKKVHRAGRTVPSPLLSGLLLPSPKENLSPVEKKKRSPFCPAPAHMICPTQDFALWPYSFMTPPLFVETRYPQTF